MYSPKYFKPYNKKRSYSTLNSNETDNTKLEYPVLSYDNADTLKKFIIYENKGKSGVYRWVNLNSGKSYVGGSVNLGKRFRCYYDIKYITGTMRNMIIHKALLNYGYSKFRLEILEFCKKDEVLAKEQYYLDLIKPEYNILKKAGSPLGFKHSKETIAK